MYVPRILVFTLLLSAPVCWAEDLLPPDRSVEEAIDHYLNARMQREAISPAPVAKPAVLRRRTLLDLIGRIPIAAEASDQAFQEGERAKLVDQLMESPAFARHQSNEFDAMLMYDVSDNLRDYLREAFQNRRPWNDIFREVLLGQPDDKQQQGAIKYVRSHIKDLDKLTNKVSVDFFGVNVSCAKCHDHPEAPEWTQAHFYGMKSFFSRTFDNGGLLGERGYGEVEYKTTSGESRQAQLMFLTGALIEEPESKPLTDAEKKAEKKQLDELKKKKQAPPAPEFSRRAQLIEVALRPEESAYFSKSLVNQVWARFMGRGIVTPVDQMHPENAPSHPLLLEWLARDFRDNGYDIRRLIRGIVLSDAYARSSRWDSAAERPANDLFAVFSVRPLTPQQYAASLKLASYSPAYFSDEKLKQEDRQKRLEQVVDGARGLAGRFELPREGFQVGVTEALFFSNNDQIRKELLRESGDSLVSYLTKIESDEALVDALVKNINGRSIDDEERTALVEFLKTRADRRQEACKQLVWVLLTGSELRFNY